MSELPVIENAGDILNKEEENIQELPFEEEKKQDESPVSENAGEASDTADTGDMNDSAAAGQAVPEQEEVAQTEEIDSNNNG